MGYIEQVKNLKNYGLYLPIPLLFGLLMVFNYMETKNPDNAYLMETILKQFSKSQIFVMSVIPLVISFFILIFWIKVIHKQSIVSVTTSRNRVDWGRILFSFMVWGIITVLLTVAQYIWFPESLQLIFKADKFIIFAILSFLLLPFQIAFEEYLFRGYLMQGIGNFTRNRVLALVITSVSFGVMHIANPEVSKIGTIALLYYIGTGFFLGILTLIDEGMELALGFHASNNIIGALLITSDWSALQTDSVFKDVSEPSAGLSIFLPLLILYPIVFLILKYKYGWKNLKSHFVYKA